MKKIVRKLLCMCALVSTLFVFDGCNKGNSEQSSSSNGSDSQTSSSSEEAAALSVEERLSQNETHIVIDLTADVTLPVTQKPSWGGADTQSITINGNGHTLILDNSVEGLETMSVAPIVGATNVDAKLIFNNLEIKTVKNLGGTWDTHDIQFRCETEMNGVTFLQEIALYAIGKTMKLNEVTIQATKYDAYAIWLVSGTHLEMTDCTISSIQGRTLKICDQHVTNPETSLVVIKNTSFASWKKSAVFVGSNAGAEITLENIDISAVNADSEYAVWIDEDYADTIDFVLVYGGQKRGEWWQIS